MSIKEQVNKVYVLIERTAEEKPNIHVIQKLDDLRQIRRRVKTTHSTTLHPTLMARLLRVTNSG